MVLLTFDFLSYNQRGLSGAAFGEEVRVILQHAESEGPVGGDLYFLSPKSCSALVLD